MMARLRPPMAASVPGKTDDGVFFLYVAAGELVGFGDADDFGDAGKIFKVAAVDFALVAGDADGGALRAGQRMGAKAHLFNVVADGLDLFLRGLRLHDESIRCLSKLLVYGNRANGTCRRAWPATASAVLVAAFGMALFAAPFQPQPGQVAELDHPGDGVGGGDNW